MNLMTASDVGVDIKSDALADKQILFGITGGIAAVDSIRVLREFRRHSANVTVIMTRSAQSIISPLAVEWASQSEVITDWNPKMSQLEMYDGIIVTPATRNCMSAYVHGVLDTPLQMALSSARGQNIPTLFVPSMHGSLFDDPVTDDLCQQLESMNVDLMWGNEEEGRKKQPDPISIVARMCHVVNRHQPCRQHAIVTLGANRSQVDKVRWIQNTSSGKTGWEISQYLYRKGHNVTVVAGQTTHKPDFQLPDVHTFSIPKEMLMTLLELAKSTNPSAWIHSAAVLDYTVAEPAKTKISSGKDSWKIELQKSAKHLESLSAYCEDAIRIGFKLEYGLNDEELVAKAKSLIEMYDLSAVVANHLEELESNTRRALWVHSDGEVKDISDIRMMCEYIEQTMCG